MIELVTQTCRGPRLAAANKQARSPPCNARQRWPRGPIRCSIHPDRDRRARRGAWAGVRIGPFCTVGADAVIEDGARLVSHVVVDGHTRIGPDVVLYPFCTVGLAPQDLKYQGEPTRCEIGARTQIREHCTIHRGTRDRQAASPGSARTAC